MKREIVIAAFLLVSLSCARAFPDWYDHQDRTIKMPRFGLTKIDAVIDGPMAQALRVVEEDFLPPPSKRHGCIDSPAVLVYEVIRRGDIIFVEVSQNLEACGDHSAVFDGSGRYAVSLDGRILRRMLDLEPGDEEPSCPPSPYLLPEYREEFENMCSGRRDAGTGVEEADGRPWTFYPTNPDGGSAFCPPSSFLLYYFKEQAKKMCPDDVDTGLDAGTSDAGSPDGGSARQ